MTPTTSIDELVQEKPWFTKSVQLQNPPVGMLGSRESLLCYYLARDAFEGSGTIIDAGSFLGRSAYFFAEGLRANRLYVPGRDRIHCFDNFLVNEDGTVRYIGQVLRQAVAIGDSTRKIFDAQIAPVREMLEIHAGDFQTISWSPQPIEILFVDIAKNSKLCGRVADLFFPNLIPGKSIVIHQDYHHPWLPHIHVMMEYLAEYFELIVPRVDDSIAFRFLAPIPRNVLQRAIDYDFSHEEQVALIRGAIARLAEEDRYYVELARIVLQRLVTDPAILRQELDSLHERFVARDLGYTGNSYFDQVGRAIGEMEVWHSLLKQEFLRCLDAVDKVLAQSSSALMMTARGHALVGLGRLSEAEEQLRAALKLNPFLAYTHLQLAQALMEQNRFDESEVVLLQALRDPRVEPPHGGMGDYLDLLGILWGREADSYEKGAATVDTLHREFPDNPEIWILETRLRYLNGELEQAQSCLNKASELGIPRQRLSQISRGLGLSFPHLDADNKEALTNE